MNKRFITRLELDKITRKRLDVLTNLNGMTQVAALSRVVQWFADQPDDIQAAILDRYPGAADQDVQKMILLHMADDAG